MNDKTTNSGLEDIMMQELKTGDCSIERALLVASGLETEAQIEHYVRKLDGLQEDFNKWRDTDSNSQPKKTSEEATADSLLDYIWKSRPQIKRAEDGADFLLTDVIDNHLAGDKTQIVENCLGLTSLYTVLGLRERLDLSVLLGEDHILNILNNNGKNIVIENPIS